jgi:hypothetical protein
VSFLFPLPGHHQLGQVDQGVDISAPAHVPLLAVADGTIVRHGIGGFGQWAPVLKLDRPVGGYSYVYYGHAGPGNAVRDGTHVKAGQVIGEVGAGIVGISTGPHLEIGFSDAAGTPAGPKGGPQAIAMKQLLSGAKQPSYSATIGQNQSALQAPAAVNVSGIPGAVVSALGNAIFGGINWKYAGLVVALVVGGFVMAGKGLKDAAGVHPKAAA